MGGDDDCYHCFFVAAVCYCYSGGCRRFPGWPGWDGLAGHRAFGNQLGAHRLRSSA